MNVAGDQQQSNDKNDVKGESSEVAPVESEWGKKPEDHFGYASEEERLAKRGMEDWELLDKLPESQRGVPKWFLAVIAVVLLVAVGLSFPFWGDRPGYERSWFNWGFVAALIYIAAAGTFVYFMVRFAAGGRARDHGQDREGKTKSGNHDERGDRQDRG